MTWHTPGCFHDCRILSSSQWLGRQRFFTLIGRLIKRRLGVESDKLLSSQPLNIRTWYDGDDAPSGLETVSEIATSVTPVGHNKGTFDSPIATLNQQGWKASRNSYSSQEHALLPEADWKGMKHVLVFRNQMETWFQLCWRSRSL